MNLREHVVLGGAAAAALSPALGVEGSLAFWAASVLIDVDHYWDYVQKNGFRNWSPGKMFEFHGQILRSIRRPELLALNLFHTVEWFLLVYLIGRWSGGSLVMAALWGMVFHLGLDVARLAWHRAVLKRALSVVEYWIRRQRLRERGLDPDEVYREALMEIGVVPAERLVEAGAPETSV